MAAIAALGDERGREPLEARLNDPVQEVVWNAANALTHLGSAAGEGILRRLLQPEFLAEATAITDEQSQHAMRAAVESLARLEAVAAEELGLVGGEHGQI